MAVPLPLFVPLYGFEPVGRGVPVLTPGRRTLLAVDEVPFGFGPHLVARFRAGEGTPIAPLRGLARGPGITRGEGIEAFATYAVVSLVGVGVGAALRGLGDVGQWYTTYTGTLIKELDLFGARGVEWLATGGLLAF